eukprot:scaffold130784_cov40-Prasinocladus_malaysianus.AAC.1
MCRFSERANLRRRDIVFARRDQSVTLSFLRRKNCHQYRQGSRVTLAASVANAIACPVRTVATRAVTRAIAWRARELASFSRLQRPTSCPICFFYFAYW